MKTFVINRRVVEDQLVYITAPDYAEALRRAKALANPTSPEDCEIADRARMDGFDTSDPTIVGLTFRSMGTE